MNPVFFATSSFSAFESSLFALFWTILIFLSIAWYGFLIFYIGFKGGREIKAMTEKLAGRADADKPE